MAKQIRKKKTTKIRKKHDSKMGRPRKELSAKDWRQFEKFCRDHCTEQEIADWLEVSVDTLERRVSEHYGTTFAEAYKKYQAQGKMSLRRWQWKKAKEGNVVMLIWLGKQHLDQKDHHTLSGREGEPIPIIVNGVNLKNLPAPKKEGT